MLLAFALGLDRVSTRRIVGLAVAFSGVAIVVALGSGSELSFDNAKGPLRRPRGSARLRPLRRDPQTSLLGRYDLLALQQRQEPRRHRRSPAVRAGLDRRGRRGCDAVRGPPAAVPRRTRDPSRLHHLEHRAQGIRPTRAVTYAYAIPPLAVAFVRFFLDETVTIWLALGGTLVVGGSPAAQGVSLPRRATRTAPFGAEPAGNARIAGA